MKIRFPTFNRDPSILEALVMIVLIVSFGVIATCVGGFILYGLIHWFGVYIIAVIPIIALVIALKKGYITISKD